MKEFIKGMALGAIAFGIPLLVWVYKTGILAV